jgi:hypothetical protein
MQEKESNTGCRNRPEYLALGETRQSLVTAVNGYPRAIHPSLHRQTV